MSVDERVEIPKSGVRPEVPLKAKQKQKLSEVMFSVVCAHYKEHGQMPADTELDKLAKMARSSPYRMNSCFSSGLENSRW